MDTKGIGKNQKTQGREEWQEGGRKGYRWKEDRTGGLGGGGKRECLGRCQNHLEVDKRGHHHGKGLKERKEKKREKKQR